MAPCFPAYAYANSYVLIISTLFVWNRSGLQLQKHASSQILIGTLMKKQPSKFSSPGLTVTDLSSHCTWP